MTSNKHKRSTPHKSPQKPSPHKSHKPQNPQKSHKTPQEKAKPLKPNSSNSPNSPILPPKYARAARPILPPTRRVLFPQSSKQSNSQQPFPSPPPAKKDHSKTGKHALSSPATKPSDDRPLKKQCLSSPSPAKNTKLVPRESNKVDRQAGMSTSSDDDEDEDEGGTPSPPSRKRKSDAIAGAAGRHKKPSLSIAAPPKAANVTPPKRCPSPIPTIQPNSKAVNMIDITVLRLEKEELQKRLDTSVQQAQQAMNDVKKWETKYKATIDTQETVNRLLDAEMAEKEKLQSRIGAFTQQAHESKLEAENWEDRWKATSEKNNSLRKRRDSKTREHDAAEANTEQWQLQHRIETDKNAKLQRELKQAKKCSQKDHIQNPRQFANKVVQLEQELSLLKSQNTKIGHRKEREEYLEATNKLLAKQITELQEELRNIKEKSSEKVVWQRDDRAKEVAQLKEVVQNTKNELAKKFARLKEEMKQNEALTVQTTQLQEDLSFKSTLASQTSRTHLHETSTLHQKITHLQSELTKTNQELHTLHKTLLSQTSELNILTSNHATQVKKLQEEKHNLEIVNRYKDMGLEKMGLLVAGWTLKWQSIGAGNGIGNGAEGKIPSVEGLGVCVNGVRM
ncbi:hypothetical protein OCU04_006559 [Sclerotinia nivalis]|uniref:Uncharacterized protein n=1 Tax=Sclerotinia nivalis TaxID=352851 RepID=A0A9X0AK02_9HELO|nr:hypothetical protein OCU04_006559 [Sclerotinia nivalis]